VIAIGVQAGFDAGVEHSLLEPEGVRVRRSWQHDPQSSGRPQIRLLDDPDSKRPTGSRLVQSEEQSMMSAR
jgi:hypothetical protein